MCSGQFTVYHRRKALRCIADRNYHLRLFSLVPFSWPIETQVFSKTSNSRNHETWNCTWDSWLRLAKMFEKATEKYQVLKAVEMLFLGISISCFFVRELCSLMDKASSHGLGKDVLCRTYKMCIWRSVLGLFCRVCGWGLEKTFYEVFVIFFSYI